MIQRDGIPAATEEDSLSEKNMAVPGPWRTPAPVRAAFFDVDGTMLSHRLGTEPASTR